MNPPLTNEQLANLIATAIDYKKRGVDSLVWRTADVLAIALELQAARKEAKP